MESSINIIQLLYSLGIYILGVITGYVIRSFIVTTENNRIELSRIIVIMVVTGVWLLSTLVDMLDVGYSTNPLVHGLMGIIVGFFFKKNEN